MKLVFKEPDIDISFSSVKLLWNDENKKPIPLTKSVLSSEWSVELNELEPGHYGYRFLVNDRFTLNDPMANMYQADNKKMLWSLLVIDDDGTQLFNNEQYHVHIEAIRMNDDYYEDDREFQTEFATDKSKRVVIRYDLSEVSGVHTASVLWTSPDKKECEWAEENLSESGSIWFGLELAALSDTSSGTWSAHLFIDGNYVLSNDFTIKYVPFVSVSFNVSI